MSSETQRITIQLPGSLREYVSRQAMEQERSESAVIRRLIAEAEKSNRGHRAA
jgi:hypothetical protein